MKYPLISLFMLLMVSSYAQMGLPRKNRFWEGDTVAVHPLDSFEQSNNYVVYKGDTFNRKDSLGFIQGSGLVLELDSSWDETYWGTRSYGDFFVFQNRYDLYYSVHTIMYGDYVDGKKMGEWLAYGANRNKTFLTYRNDVMDGPVRKFHPSGQLKYEGLYHYPAAKVHLKRYSLYGLMLEEKDYDMSFLMDLD